MNNEADLKEQSILAIIEAIRSGGENAMLLAVAAMSYGAGFKNGAKLAEQSKPA